MCSMYIHCMCFFDHFVIKELALYGDLTMLETMFYFGILHQMHRKKVKERGNFLLTLLELPSQTKLIRKLR